MRKNTLRTDRLLLRPFEARDSSDALTYRDDPEFVRYLPHIPQPFTQENADAFVALNTVEPWGRSPVYAVVLGDRVIGTVNLEIDKDARSAMLGYAIGRAWWGQGIATEAAREVIAWGIATFDLNRIWAATDVRNVRSQRVLEKLGMKRELLRVAEGRDRNGDVIHEAVYAIEQRISHPC